METGAAQSKLGREAELNIPTRELMSSPSAISECIDSPQTLTRLNRPARSPERRIHYDRRPSRSPEPRVPRYQTSRQVDFFVRVSVGIATRFCRLVRFFMKLWAGAA